MNYYNVNFLADYLLVRLEAAKELLQITDKNVSQIAYKVGFKELAYFSRCFSEEYGISPVRFGNKVE